MACGKAVIVPQHGPADEFVGDESGYKVKSQLVEGEHPWSLAGPATEIDIDVADLRRTMRKAFEDATETRAMGIRASLAVQGLTWTNTAHVMERRLRALRDSHQSAQARKLLAIRIQLDNDQDSLSSMLGVVAPFVDEMVVCAAELSPVTRGCMAEYGCREAVIGANALEKRLAEWVVDLDYPRMPNPEDMRRLRPMLADIPASVKQLEYSVRYTLPDRASDKWTTGSLVLRRSDPN